MAEARIVYVATTDGIIQLANPGKSDRWLRVGRGLQGEDVCTIVTSPDDPQLAYAASGGGVWRTRDGGQHWDNAFEQAALSLSYDSTGTLYAGMERGVVLSTTDGETWQESEAFSAPVIHVTMAGDTILSIARDGTVSELQDGQWKPFDICVPFIRGATGDPADAQHYYLVNKSSLVTTHGTHRLTHKPTGALVLLQGETPTLLIGTDGPLLRSDQRGDNITEIAEPDGVTALVTPPHLIDQAYAGTSTGGFWFSRDRGRSWTMLGDGFGRIQGIAFARAL